METRFHYDLKDKQLCFNVRQRVTTSNKLEFKATGLLDPNSGTISAYRASVKQYIHSGSIIKDSPNRPLRIGGGVALVPKSGSTLRNTTSSSSVVPSATPVVAVQVDKKLDLFDGPNTILTLRAKADWDLASRNMSTRSGLAKVSHKLTRFTARQDLKLSVGLTVDWPAGKRDPKPALYLQVRENSWSATLRDGRTYLTYDL